MRPGCARWPGGEGIGMRRPLALIGFACFGTLIGASLCGFWTNLGLGVLLCAAASVAFGVFRGAKATAAAALVLLTAGLSMGAWCGAYALKAAPALALSGQDATVTATVLDGPTHGNGDYYYTVQASKIVLSDGRAASNTRLYAGFSLPLTAKPYDTVTFQAHLEAPSGGSGYGSATYYRSKGIYLLAWQSGTADPAVTENSHKPLMYYAVALRRIIHDRIAAVGGQPGLLAAGVLIGDTTGLDGSIQNDFTATGISHLLAVSGTQTSLIAQCLLLLLCALKVPRRWAAGTAMTAVAAFMAVTGFTASVSRAGIMSLIFLFGILIGREADALNSLGASVLVLCAVNPFAAADVGLQLSFAATLGMILVSSRLLKLCAKGVAKWPKIPRRLVLYPTGVLCETAGASLFSVPVIMLTFHNLSLVSPVSNLIEVPLSLVVTLVSALLAAAFPVPFLRVPLAFVLRLFSAAMIAVAHGLASLPHALVSSDYGFVYILVAFALCAAGVFLLFRKKGANPAVPVVCCAFAVSCGILSYTMAQRHVLEIDCLAVGKGSTTVLLCDGRAVVAGLSGTDPAGRVEALFKSRNVSSLSALVLPTYSREAVDAANALLRDYPCSMVICPASFQAQGNEFLHFVTFPEALQVFGACALTVLPDGEGGLSLVAQPGGGGRILLLAGKGQPDVGTCAALRPSLVIFGGKVDAAVAKSLAPSYAVAGGGVDSLYACPGFSAAGAVVYRTSEAAVCLRTRNGLQYQIASS